MKPFHIRFEADPSLEGIEVLIRAPEENDEVAAIMKRLSGDAQKTFTVYDRFDNIKLLPAENIVRVSVEGKQINIITERGSYYLRQTMRTFESALDERQFVRISRYEIVNLAKVVSFDFTLAGTLQLELAGGMETWASRRCIPAIRKMLTGKEREQ